MTRTTHSSFGRGFCFSLVPSLLLWGLVGCLCLGVGQAVWKGDWAKAYGPAPSSYQTEPDSRLGHSVSVAFAGDME